MKLQWMLLFISGLKQATFLTKDQRSKHVEQLGESSSLSEIDKNVVSMENICSVICDNSYTTRILTGSKFDIINQSTFLTQSFDVTHAVRVIKNVACLSSLIIKLAHQLCFYVCSYNGLNTLCGVFILHLLRKARGSCMHVFSSTIFKVRVSPKGKLRKWT